MGHAYGPCPGHQHLPGWAARRSRRSAGRWPRRGLLKAGKTLDDRAGAAGGTGDPAAVGSLPPVAPARRTLVLVSGERRRLDLALASGPGQATLVITADATQARAAFAAAAPTALGRVLVLSGGIDDAEAARRAAEIRATRYAMVALEPDALWHPRLAGAITVWQPANVAIDLAHMAAHAAEQWLMLEETLRRLERLCPHADVTVLDGALGPQVRAMLAATVSAQPQIAAPVLPDQIALRVRRLGGPARAQLLVAMPEIRTAGTLLVAPSRRVAQGLSTALTRMGRQAGLYHSGLPALERQAAVEAYREGRLPLLVTTAAILELAGLPAPHAIVLSHPPASPDVLLRLAEAAAVATREMALLVVWAPGDLEALSARARRAIPTLAALRNLYAWLRSREAGGRVYLVEDELGTRAWSGEVQPMRLRGELALLELAGYLRRRAAVARAGTVTLLSETRQGDLGRAATTASARPGVPRPFDLLGLATALSLDPSGLQDLLLQAETDNLLALRLVGHHALYEFTAPPAAAAEELRRILAVLCAAAEDDAARIAAFLGSPGCRVQALLRALDLPAGPTCGRCDGCTSGAGQPSHDLPLHLALSALAGVPLGVRPGAARRLVLFALHAAGRGIGPADATDLIEELRRRGWVEDGPGRLGQLLRVSSAGLQQLATGP